MHCMYKQLHPPTGIEHCVYANFFNWEEKNLIIAGVNQLHVYRLNTEPELVTPGGTVKDIPTLSEKEEKTHLECLASYSLHGNIQSLEAVRLAGASRDVLLLSFMDAKLSVVEYDPSTKELKTSSLHQFEELDIRGGYTNNTHLPTIRTDPDGRCAGMLVYGTHLVVLPFRKDLAMDDLDTAGGGSGTTQKSPIMSSYTIDLRSMDEKIINIVDIQFLHGYFEPTVFLLYEPLATWAGRTAVRSDTCSIVAISLNIQQKVHPIIWAQASLPFDAFSVVPVPKPIGGVVILAVNSILYLNQSVPPFGVSLNAIAQKSSSFPLKVQEETECTLDCARIALISSDRFVLSLKGGEIYVLTLVVDSMRCVRGFHMERAASSVLTTCICLCGDGYLFLGSRLGNSLLLKYTEKASETVVEEEEKRLDAPANKKRRIEGQEQLASDVSEVENLDELEVYGAVSNQMGTTISSYTFEVCDSIWNIAPCSQVAYGEPAFLSEEYGSHQDPDLELVTCSGHSKNGALSVLQHTIRPQVVTTFPLTGCIDIWTVRGPDPDPDQEEEEEEEGEEMTTATDVIKGEGKKEEEEGGEGDDASATDEKKEGEEEGEGAGEGEGPGEGEGEGQEQEPKPKAEKIVNAHSYLVLSRRESSMVLETGAEINELDHSGFSTQTATVFVGNIGEGNRYILQVSPSAIRLLDGIQQIQHIPVDLGSSIQSCSVCDPHVILMGAEGRLMMFTLKEDRISGGARLHATKMNLSMTPRILAMTTYRDFSGLFITQSPVLPAPEVKVEKVAPTLNTSLSINSDVVDDEDELLYAEVSAPKPQEMKAPQQDPKQKKPLRQISPTSWMVVSRENGQLEIYSLSDFKLAYLIKSFPLGQRTLVDSGPTYDLTKSGSSSGLTSDKAQQQQQQAIGEMPVVKEVQVFGLGHNKTRPYLMARVDEELLIYEAFPHIPSAADAHLIGDHLRLRFKKITHNLILKEKRVAGGGRRKAAAGGGGGVGGEEEEEPPDENALLDHIQQLRYFDNVSGYSGVFICGPYPHWLFMTSKGSLRIHPMSIDGWITCFTPFHNVNCPNGFLYFNHKSDMCICVLPTHVTYDAPWPIRKVPLRCTPHYITYHTDSKLYAVVTSTKESTNKMPRIQSDDREWDYVERGERFIYPEMSKYTLQLFTPSTWEPIPDAKYDCGDWEHITCLTNAQLKSEGTLSGLKGYMTIGTAYCMGEDVVARGRIIIIDIIEVVPEPGKPLTKNKIKVLYDKEQKGPVSAITYLNGLLISAIGQKIYIWSLKDEDLSGVAFIDSMVYIHSFKVIKNLILASDVLKSITVYRYQEDLRVLSFVSRDFRPLETYSAEFMVDGGTLCFAVTDKQKNILLYSYVPETRDSVGGTRLLRRADFNLGSHVNAMFRVRCKLVDPSTGKKNAAAEHRHITYHVSLDGSIGYLLPIPEKVYRRQQMLQNSMMSQLPNLAGLNPKAYRSLKSNRMDTNPQRNILDGEMCSRFLFLSHMEKTEVAKRIGTTVDQLVDDLMEFDRLTAHF